MKVFDVDKLNNKIDNQLKHCHGYTGNKKDVYREALLTVKSMIKTENCIEIEPTIHAQWKDVRDYCGEFMCSACLETYCTNKHNYCPHCGAKMCEKEKQND